MSSAEEEKYNQTMVGIGIYYISITSLFFIFPVIADLFNGYRNGKFWIPCKHFRMDLVSVIAIGVVVKLPIEYVWSPVASWEGQVPKLGATALMSIMVVDMLPSLISLDNKTLVAYVLGYATLFVTVIADTCIEINAGVIRHVNSARILVGIFVLLLLALISVGLAVATINNMSESRYEAICQRISEEVAKEGRLIYSMEKLRQEAMRYRMMAQGNPEFVMASSNIIGLCGAICAIVTVIYIVMAVDVLMKISSGPPGGYRWLVVVMVTTQSIGAVVGSIAPICRLFTSVSRINASIERNWRLATIVEQHYWTHILYEWEQIQI